MKWANARVANAMASYVVRSSTDATYWATETVVYCVFSESGWPIEQFTKAFEHHNAEHRKYIRVSYREKQLNGN